jgi:mono/diheme cytochrome c family protein
MIPTRLAAALALAAACLALAGCVRSPEAQFKFNALWAQQQVGRTESYNARRAQEIVDITRAMFGTPDDPFVPVFPETKAVQEALRAPLQERLTKMLDELNVTDEKERAKKEDELLAGFAAGTNDLVDRNLLALSAGPVKTSGGITKGGLYRQHCVHCHGISGDGQGPTGLYLNPYPRDYRLGIYKFKSTGKGERPTDDDLRKIIVDGIPGTAMPSFKLLSSDEIESLVNYVKYLSLRGEVERSLIAEEPLTSKDEYTPPAPDAKRIMDGHFAPVVALWLRNKFVLRDVTPPEWTKEQRSAALAAGQRIFYGLGACKDCHGESQLGDGTIDAYDEWSTYLSPTKNPDGIGVYLSLGAFPPRPIRPRNLRSGVYRGGRRPLDLFWRVRTGIDGSGMPAAQVLSDEQVWQVVEYVRSLPYEPISDPFHGRQPVYQKPRN